MTNEQQPSPTADFLVRLRKIDKQVLTMRDVLVLYAVLRSPGISGVEISKKLGFPNRSSISSNVTRLIREGYIEDHREERRKANPTMLHATAAGRAFWDEIKP
jgi:DNA-binding MarR family transcriptional regulator